MLKLLAPAVGLATFAATLAWAQSEGDWADQKDWASGYAHSQGVCRSVKARRIAAADMPDAATRASLKGCDAEALYYGIGRPRDPVRARQCAIVQLDDPEMRDDPFGGAALLMTIYANGVGAARDLDLAIHFSCITWGAPEEHEGRVESLLAMKGKSSPPEFGYCDDTTSGMAGGQCAAHDQRFTEVKREAAFAAFAKGWKPATKQAFARLRTVTTAFIDARTSNEVDLSGTLRGAFAIQEEEARWKAFEAVLDRLAKGEPAGTPASRAAADAALNAVYRKVQAAKPQDGEWGTVTPEGVRQTERAWIAYRDAWLAFAKTAYPKASADGLAQRLTEERTKMLREILEPV